MQTNRDASRQQLNLESETRTINDQKHQTETIHYEHKVYQDKEAAFDKEAMTRHNEEIALVTALKEKKQKAKEDLEAELEQNKQDFLSLKDYQDSLEETAKLREQIEAAKVKIQFLDVQVNLLSEATEFLNQKRDDLTEEKKLAESKNEELKTQAKA